MPTAKSRRAASVVSISSQQSDVTLLPLNRDDVARRAFELDCARGCEGGSDLDDWFSAERELRTIASVSTAA